MFTKIANFSIKYRWAIIFGFIIITIFFAFQIPNTKIEPDIKSQIPQDFDSRLKISQIEDIFGGTEFITVVLETKDVLNPNTLTRIKKLSRKLERLKGVDKVISLSTIKDIRVKNSELLVETLYKKTPRTPKEISDLKLRIKENELIYGKIISRDFGATAIISFIDVDSKDEVLTSQIKKLLAKYPGNEKIYIGGLPLIRAISSKYIQRDTRIFQPLGLFIMLIFLFICFKELRGVFLPFIIVVMSIIFSFGLISLIGWKMHVITVILPIVLIAVANDYGIHLIAHYQEIIRKDPDKDKKAIILEITKKLGGPVIVTGITTISGLMALLAHIIIPAKELGILASAGIGFALFGSLLFIPAFLYLLPKSKSKYTPTNIPKLEKWLHHTALFVSKKPKKTIVIATIISLIV